MVRTTSIGLRRRSAGAPRSTRPASQDLDRHLAPVARRRHVDLGDGGGGHRLVLEMAKQLLDRLAQLALDRRARLVAGEGRQMVLQCRQIGRHVLAQEVRTGGEHLAELYEARPHALDGVRQALAGAERQHGAAFGRLGQRLQGGGEKRRDAEALEQEQRVVSRQAMADIDQSDEVPDGAEHGERVRGAV